MSALTVTVEDPLVILGQKVMCPSGFTAMQDGLLFVAFVTMQMRFALWTSSDGGSVSSRHMIVDFLAWS